MQNSVDTLFILPQYLVSWGLLLLFVGSAFPEYGPELRICFSRENRSRRILHGNEEEGKKEETLTVGETIPRIRLEFHWPLERSTSSGAFPWWDLVRIIEHRGRRLERGNLILPGAHPTMVRPERRRSYDSFYCLICLPSLADRRVIAFSMRQQPPTPECHSQPSIGRRSKFPWRPGSVCGQRDF
jgi:hypothetical protein